jgi:predicted RNA-binding protein YlqC (UPF0109 family)
MNNDQLAAMICDAFKKVIQHLVSMPSSVTFDLEGIDDTSFAAVLRAASQDAPAIVGKGGLRIKALGSLISRAGALRGLTIATQFSDYNMGHHDQRRDFAPNFNWQADAIMESLQAVARLLFSGEVTVQHKDIGVLTAIQIAMPASGNNVQEVADTMAELGNIFIAILKTNGRQMMMKPRFETTDGRPG